LGFGLQAFDKHEYLKGVPIPDFARPKNNLKKKDFLPKKARCHVCIAQTT